MNPIEPKKIRVRDNLSTIQVNDQQKQIIDAAFKLFQDQEGSQTKGMFLETLARHYLGDDFFTDVPPQIQQKPKPVVIENPLLG
jgi:hypothetical protein